MSNVIPIDEHRVQFGTNGMSRAEFQRRVMSQLTQIAQHLALAISTVADGKGRYEASMRDLEELTGWGKSTIAAHLPELTAFFAVLVGDKRQKKTTFEMQGMIEDALTQMDLPVRQQDSKCPPAGQSLSGSGTRPPAGQVLPPAGQSLSGSGTGADATPKPAIYKERARTPDTELPSVIDFTTTSSGGGVEEVDEARLDAAATSMGVKIGPDLVEGPGFKLSIMATQLAGAVMSPVVTQRQARLITIGAALEWALAGFKPAQPSMAIRAHMAKGNLGLAVQEARVRKAILDVERQPAKPGGGGPGPGDSAVSRKLRAAAGAEDWEESVANLKQPKRGNDDNAR